ncbi:hypothetical protein ABFX02_13G091500 [Erythranthe guttata]
MEYSRLNLWYLLACVVIILQSHHRMVVGEPKVPCLFIFGDSLVDNGNNNYRETTAKVNYEPYGVDFPAGPTGRFTNGRNTIDIIAEMLGFDEYIPPYATATNQNILGGVNYGSGGAGILYESGRQLYGDVISFDEQLSNHEATISRIAKLVGGKSAAKKHLKSCLYSVGLGNNDYLANYLPKYYASTAKQTSQTFAALLIAKYTKQLILLLLRLIYQKLYKTGARNVVVFAPGKLGCVPQQISTYGSSDGSFCFETSNEIVQIFADGVKLLIDSLNKLLPGAKFIHTDTSTATSYGNITVATEPCCPTSTDVSNSGHCIRGSAVCSNRDEYLFWDAFHPTEAANLISAKIVYDDIYPLFADPIAAS